MSFEPYEYDDPKDKGPLTQNDLDALYSYCYKLDNEAITEMKRRTMEASEKFQEELIQAQLDAREQARRYVLVDLRNERQEQWDRVQEEFDRIHAQFEEERRQLRELYHQREAYFRNAYDQLAREEREEAEAQQRAQKEAEEHERLKREEEERIKKETEERLRREAEERARREAEERAKREAEEQAKKEKELEAKRQADEANRKAALVAAQKSVPSSSAASTTAPDPNIDKALAVYEEIYKNRLKLIKERLMDNQNLKNSAFQHIKIVRLRLNQLTNTRDSILNIVNEFTLVLRNVQSTGDLYNYLLNYIAENVVSQAEVETSSTHYSAAYKLAHICVLLNSQHPDLIHYMMVQLAMRCPYVIPLYHVQQPGQSIQQFNELIGYKKDEEEDKYIGRMQAIVALYAAILQTTPFIPNVRNDYSMEDAWKWLSKTANLTPRSITPYLVYTFLQIAGPKLIEFYPYPNQTQKLIRTYYNRYYLNPPREYVNLKKESAAAMSRLQTFLMEVVNNNFRFPESPGRYPTN
ncbi:7432_t:CDS:2 [Ambispora gerdemannii]|uniref:mRNA export factor GLE1 n=1 Tax=Ambispora gerdemannii TaxID=144530 RepID=A0A9N8WM35_9GLOM|nr:7432_t:CDS:2 [Ambispora gerdemannii]